MAEIYIYSGLSLRDGRQELEDDLDEFFKGRAETTSGGGGWLGWDIGLSVEDASHLPEIVPALTEFLRSWLVPPDTYFYVNREDERTLHHVFEPGELMDDLIRHLYALYNRDEKRELWADFRRHIAEILDEVERNKGRRPYPERTIISES